MRILLVILVVIVALFVGALVVASFLPADFSVQGSAVIGAPADSLYARFASPRTWARWSAWTTKADSTLRYEYEGPDAGPGAIMRFTSSRMGNGEMRIAEVVPGRDVRYDLRFTGTDMVVHGHVALEAADAGTRIAWRDSGNLGKNVLMRFLAPVLERSMASAYETSFTGLRRELGAR